VESGVLTTFDLATEGNPTPAGLERCRPLMTSGPCRFRNPIQCQLHSPVCEPHVSKLALDQGRSCLTLHFHVNTTRPAIATLEDMARVLDISPPPSHPVWGGQPAAAGENVTEDDDTFVSRWTDSRVLQLFLPRTMMDELYQRGLDGGVQVRLRSSDCANSSFRGNVTMRVSEAGAYSLGLSYALKNGSRQSMGPAYRIPLNVTHCEGYVVKVNVPPEVS
jgi:hypothetical protein